MKHPNSGYTLVEIAIVLTILSLLLGMVLKGYELLNSAKVKRLATDFLDIPQLINSYQDEYHALPGDDGQASAHLGAGATICSPAPSVDCNLNNGIIDGNWADTTAASESFVLWQQLRLAGLAYGATDTSAGAAYLPTNALGGLIGVQSSQSFTTITQNAAGLPSPMAGSYVMCSTGIPGKFALQLDTLLDDGNPDSGNMRVVYPNTNGSSASFAYVFNNPNQPFTVCMSD